MYVSPGELTGGIIYQERQEIDTSVTDKPEQIRYNLEASTAATFGSIDIVPEGTTVDISSLPVQPDQTQLRWRNISEPGISIIKSLSSSEEKEWN